MNKQPTLSLCVPTTGIVEWVVPLIESIYRQKVDNDLFEVIITDNGTNDELSTVMSSFKFPNLHYYKTKAQGFTNQIDAFEKCSGLFCKMLNHRSKMLPGSLERIIKLVEAYKEDKPIIYCAGGHIKGKDVIECLNIDDFVRNMSYWTSWSAGTGAWRCDLTDLRERTIDSMFPHTLFLFGLRQESRYIIWNEKYEFIATDPNKGGFNPFYTFGVNFLDIINGLRIHKRISSETFVIVKCGLYKFIRKIYLDEVLLPTRHTYICQNIANCIDVYYGRYYYWKMVIWGYFLCPLVFVKRAVLRFFAYSHF